MTAKLMLLHAVSPLHAGTGQGIGVIDLPIAREKATNLPHVPGSTLKGILRDNCPDDDLRDRVFGKLKPSDPQDFYAGSAQFSDARLLLMPVRSLYGTFAWVTCPYILARLARDLKDAGLTGPAADAPEPQSKDTCLVTSKDAVIAPPAGQPAKVFLEDLDFTAAISQPLGTWAAWIAGKLFPNEPGWQTRLTNRLCLIHDDRFAFLLDTATEITARIRIDDDKKTVADGGLWYEEALPVETVLAALVLARKVEATVDEVDRLLTGLAGTVLQVGGKATVGRGLCRFQVS